MVDALDLRETPQADFMLVGWRQWADAGSLSSSLPKYLIDRTNARPIGSIKPDGFYLFQFPGMHDLMRPVIRFENGYPADLESPHNELYYAEVGGKGIIYLLGDEPNLDVERYVSLVLDAAEAFGVTKTVGFGGVYAEVPYDKERTISATYSLKALKPMLDKLAVTFSDYHGGASINSVLCRRAAERRMSYTSFYAFVPNYDLSRFDPLDNTIRLENDFMAWMGVMRRLNFFLKTEFDLDDLKKKTQHLLDILDSKVAELEDEAPSAGLRTYFDHLAALYDEPLFDPLDDVWENALRGISGLEEDDEG